MRRQLLTIAFAWASVVAGCGSSGPPASPDATRTCEPAACWPFLCDEVRDRCHQRCFDDATCAPGRVCADGACVGTACTPATAAAVCGPYACVQGDCATDCGVAPCADGYYCRGDTHACVVRCTRRGDPGCDGYVCDVDVGECEPYCLPGELPCAAGYACAADERCVEDVTAPPCSAGCGAYACVTALDRCAVHCLDDADCAAGATCTAGSCG